MILYSLACDIGHRFESWFRDSFAYDDQIANDLVTCPTCRSTRIAKTIMAPAVLGTRIQVADSGEPMDLALIDDKDRKLRGLLKDFREKLVAEADDVGPRFATEARRIHEGKAPERRIYGQASRAEANGLLEDGIMVLPMPVVPDELN